MADSVSFNKDSTKGEPEGHEEKMVAKYEGREVEEDKEAVSGDQASTEDSEQSAQTDKSSADEAGEDTDKESSEDNEESQDDDGSEEETNEEPDGSGLIAKYTEQYQSDGELSDDAYDDLEKNLGVSRAEVDEYIGAREAAASAITEAAYAVAGGQEEFKRVAEWAGSNLTPEERDAHNAEVNSGDAKRAIKAVTQLQARFQDATGTDPDLEHGEAPNTSPKGFKSAREMTDAMRDPRYAKDSAYRAEVDTKIANMK